VAKLVIFRGDSVESELHLGRQTVRIGRDTRNDIVLDDKTVTRFHAEVIPEGGRFYIADLNSRNGVWINNQRIKGKTPLALGVAATVGAYELTLEDDVASSDFDDLAQGAAPTVVSTSASPQASSSSTARGGPAARPGVLTKATSSPALFWPIVAVGTVILCVATYLAVRRFTAPKAPEAVPAVVKNDLPPPPSEPPAEQPKTEVARNIIAGYLEAAQYAIDDRDYEAARDDIDAALELDPTNQELLAKRKQVEDLIAAPPPPPIKPPPPKPAAPEVQEAPGIPRRANEPAAEYTARVGRIQANMRDAKRYLEQEEFAAAIARFQAVERDQESYQNTEALLADAAARQKKQVDTAIDNGQQNERAGNLLNAVRWYDRALRLDPNSAAAQQKLASIAEKRTKEGLSALTKADVFRKRNEVEKAIAAYQQAVDLLPATNEKRAEAQQWLEKLKQ
jgi:cytochrome c-type biogenesis protein CcmH/NrfG